MCFGWPLFCFALFVASQKKNTSVEDDIKVADFMRFFKEVKVPLAISDSVFLQKKDTISYKAFCKFIPDSVLAATFHGTKPKIYPIAKVTVKNGETYLFTKVTTSAKKVAYLSVFNNKDEYKTSMPLIIADNDKTTTATASMDSRYTLTLLAEQNRSNQEAIYKKDVYVYNTAGIFTLILTESNKRDSKPAEVINPIDTFAAKQKLSGDYVQNKYNFISFRDGRKQGYLQFFIHFEKDNGTCKGELKGDAKIISDKLVRYSETGSPCVIEFAFAGKNVTMKEVGGCGSYRDIKCFFEGSFVKKQPAKKQKTKK